jgi:hypothetical protein
VGVKFKWRGFKVVKMHVVEKKEEEEDMGWGRK